MTVNILPEMGQFASIIKGHRKRSGLNQQELARLAGVGKTAVFDLEKGKPTVQCDTLLKVLQVLNIHMILQSPPIDEPKTTDSGDGS